MHLHPVWLCEGLKLIKVENQDAQFQQLQTKIFKLSLVDFLACFLPGIHQQQSNNQTLRVSDLNFRGNEV